MVLMWIKILSRLMAIACNIREDLDRTVFLLSASTAQWALCFDSPVQQVESLRGFAVLPGFVFDFIQFSSVLNVLALTNLIAQYFSWQILKINVSVSA
jgi:hypothetical protein